MNTTTENLLTARGGIVEDVVNSTVEFGQAVRKRRKQLGLRQLDIAGMANTGNRLIVELERGKPTVQLRGVLEVLDLLGLELVVRPRAVRAP
jgi:HTH-type transcriptional regulator / antitoxin HipB